MMRGQKEKSLFLLDDDVLLENMLKEMPVEKNLIAINNDVLLDEYQHMASGSFDVIGAAADYFVEHNRTVQLRKRIAAEESALNTRNAEAERQSKIKLCEYAKQLKVQVGTWEKDLEIGLQKARMTAQRIVGITEGRKRVWQSNMLIRSIIVREQCQIYDLQECMRNLDKLGIDGHETHYMQMEEEVVKLVRHADKLRKQIIL